MSNTNTVNGSALNEDEGSYFTGIFTKFLSDIRSSRLAGPIVNFNQSVGVPREESIFILFDQQVVLRSITNGGPFVDFYQNVKHQEQSGEIVTFNQKVMP